MRKQLNVNPIDGKIAVGSGGVEKRYDIPGEWDWVYRIPKPGKWWRSVDDNGGVSWGISLFEGIDKGMCSIIEKVWSEKSGKWVWSVDEISWPFCVFEFHKLRDAKKFVMSDYIQHLSGCLLKRVFATSQRKINL